MKASELILPAAVVIGGAYVLNKFVPQLPNPFQPIVDWWTSIFTRQTGMFTFTRDTMRRTETNSIAAAGLVPNTTVIYGWKELAFSRLLATDVSGNLFFEFYIADSTPNGTYTIYLDQRPYGGGYGERKLTVTS